MKLKWSNLKEHQTQINGELTFMGCALIANHLALDGDFLIMANIGVALFCIFALIQVFYWIRG